MSPWSDGDLSGGVQGGRATWLAVTIDCLDPERVAEFWSTLLGRDRGPSEPSWVYLGAREDPLPWPVFQSVSEKKVGETRIHLDIEVDDIAAGIALVLDLGGAEAGERHDYDQGTVV